MDDDRRVRPDPCTLMYEVTRRGTPEDPAEVAERAVQLWALMAGRAGWSVEIEAGGGDTGSGAVGVVGVEGIRYAVHVGPRKRMAAIDPSSGSVVERVVLTRAVWVEPVVTDALLADYP